MNSSTDLFPGPCHVSLRSDDFALRLTPEKEEEENPWLSDPGAGESVRILGVEIPLLGRPSMKALATFSELSS
jgi:hypothetical protein